MRLPLLLLGCAVPAGPFQVRLAGGPSGCAGRVEISYKGRWGSVCDDEWDLADAAVVCRQLDCGSVLSAPVGAWFGEGAGPIWLSEVRCQGSEPHLRHCRHRGWRLHVCSHEEDASAVCSGGARGAPLRLVGGPHRCAGRLEVLHGGQWGSVCDDGWGLPEGAVVCRELGCGAVQAAPGGAHFGTGTGPIWLDDVGCSGKEMSLQLCRARPWGRSNCQHEEDASVICTGGAVLRLVGGAGPCSGRLEVFHQGRWGTVCDDRWALPGAAVVCRELGCGDPLSAPGGAFFGEGSGPIWLDNVRCWGNESALSQCLAAPWGVHDCQHAEDAGVVCTAQAVTHAVVGVSSPRDAFHPEQHGAPGTLRPIPKSQQPRPEPLETHTDAAPMTDQPHRHVLEKLRPATRALPATGFPSATPSARTLPPAATVPSTLATAPPASILQASTPPTPPLVQEALAVVWEPSRPSTTKSWGTSSVPGAGQGTVRGAGGCQEPGHESSQLRELIQVVRGLRGDLRALVHIQRQERLQLGAIAGSLAQLVGAVQQMGLPGRAGVRRALGIELRQDRAARPGGAMDLRLHFWLCFAAGLGVSSSTEVRLVDGPDRCSGRVEVRLDGRWGIVCHDGWDLDDVTVLCRQLGCGKAVKALTSKLYGPGPKSYPVLMVDVQCQGTEASLGNCSYTDAEDLCLPDDNAGAHCHEPMRPVRLVGNATSCSGQVEIYHEGRWGAVCGLGWDLTDAKVLCRELGCGSPRHVTHRCSKFSRSSAPVLRGLLECSGQEASLSDCPFQSWEGRRCPHHWDTGVKCQEPFALRLADGPTKCSGRLEVQYDGQWGTVCDDDWTASNAQVVCRELGCGPAAPLPPRLRDRPRFGQGTGQIWLDDVHCKGTEKTLQNCAHRVWGYHDCTHREDVSVVCQAS
ncbi:soluble scavenger receptor cysteine-rich domain-containing protein SSC5D [Emydura macquarii macquarii]|uniref:soluble scavenger receptor cysteine-rich domain-containing protein SSC5D n=1 Tax=Emydura macquarii macquarii TaxID=1129001 RepID=UPI00352B2ED3